MFIIEVELLIGLGGLPALPKSAKLRMPMSESVAVRLRAIRFVVERETAQIAS